MNIILRKILQKILMWKNEKKSEPMKILVKYQRRSIGKQCYLIID